MNNIHSNNEQFHDIPLGPSPIPIPSVPVQQPPAQPVEFARKRVSEEGAKALKSSSADISAHTVSIKQPQVHWIVRAPVNLIKGIWATAWTLTRLVLVTLGIPVLYCYHRWTKSPSQAAATSAANTAAVSSQVLHETGKMEMQSKASIKGKANAQPQLRTEAVQLEHLRKQARKNPQQRDAYYKHYSDHVEKLFTAGGYRAANFTGKNSSSKGHQPDERLVSLSRESYINLNLVYHFDGPDMVGREITLIDVINGEEVPVNYKVEAYFQEAHGLVGYGLNPMHNPSARPRLIFRGTNADPYKGKDDSMHTLPTGYAADAASEIGRASYQRQKKAITEWLDSVTDKGKIKAFVSGHSLGGAMAQRAAADNPNLVGEVFTLNSPRLEMEAFPIKPAGHQAVTHVVMDGDSIVPRAGGERFTSGGLLTNGHSEAEVVTISGGDHTSKLLNNYCMAGTEVTYRMRTVADQLGLDSFWALILNIIRPRITFL